MLRCVVYIYEYEGKHGGSSLPEIRSQNIIYHYYNYYLNRALPFTKAHPMDFVTITTCMYAAFTCPTLNLPPSKKLSPRIVLLSKDQEFLWQNVCLDGYAFFIECSSDFWTQLIFPNLDQVFLRSDRNLWILFLIILNISKIEADRENWMCSTKKMNGKCESNYWFIQHWEKHSFFR